MIVSRMEIHIKEIMFFIPGEIKVLLAKTPLPHASCSRCNSKGLNFCAVVCQALAVADTSHLGGSLGL